MNTKLGKVLTYSEKLPSLKAHGPLITLLTCGPVTNSKIIFPLSQVLLPVNLHGANLCE